MHISMLNIKTIIVFDRSFLSCQWVSRWSLTQWHISKIFHIISGFCPTHHRIYTSKMSLLLCVYEVYFHIYLLNSHLVCRLLRTQLQSSAPLLLPHHLNKKLILKKTNKDTLDIVRINCKYYVLNINTGHWTFLWCSQHPRAYFRTPHAWSTFPKGLTISFNGDNIFL